MTGLLTGIARYLINLYAEMISIDNVEACFFNGREFTSSLPHLGDSPKRQKHTSFLRKLPPPLLFLLRTCRLMHYEHSLCKGITPANFDLYHETELVPAKQEAIPAVFSVYDLSLQRFKEMHPSDRVWFFNYFFKSRRRYMRHILTISDFIRQEIIEEFKVSPEMVTSVPLAPAPFFKILQEQEVAQVLKRLRLPVEYLFFAGTLEPRKNIDLLIEALHIAKPHIPLVLTGWHGWGEKAWQDKIKKTGIDKRIYVTGHISDNDLAALYNGATALIYPSLYEGFGLPIIEAMSCGCPVICSHSSSMPEVAGNAALLIDPHDRENLADAIETIVFDSEKRKKLKQLGLARAKEFNWQKTAQQTLEVFKRVSDES
ncbi:MAG: glycosyltransferase family 4 protein [Desulfobulbaceae bacterium]|nr:glycosyltransferase family 4 protein [Desulfobulbaceae bacterium]